MTLLGVNDTHAAEFETALKAVDPNARVAAVRTFAAAESWPSGRFTPAVNAAKAGKVPILSVKPVSMAATAAGTEDARYRAICQGLVGAGVTKCLFVFHHEFEDEIEKGLFTFATVQAATGRVAGIAKSFGFEPWACLMGWTAHRWGRNRPEYANLPGVVGIGWDGYDTMGAVDGTANFAPNNDPARSLSVDEIYGQCLAVSEHYNKQAAIFELGRGRTNDAAGLEAQRAWYADGVETLRNKRWRYVCQFEMGVADGKAEWAIRNTPSLREFAKVGQPAGISQAAYDAEHAARVAAETRAAELFAENGRLGATIESVRTWLATAPPLP